MASAQLQLILTDTTWKLDRHTVEVGRAGIAQARAALAAASVEPADALLNGQLIGSRSFDNHQVAA